MLELKTYNDISGIFKFPMVFEHEGEVVNSVIFEFYDLINNTLFGSVTTPLNKLGHGQFDVTFSQLFDYLSPQDIEVLQGNLKAIIQDSNLYEHTLHQLKIKFKTKNKTLELTRFFNIPGIANAYPDGGLVQMNLNKERVMVNSFISEKTLSTNVIIVARCLYNDVILFNETYFSGNSFTHNIDVSNYETTLLMAFVIGKLPSYKNKLLSYNTLDLNPIIKPNISVQESKVTTTEGKKVFELATIISANVFDGIRYNDYGHLFIKNGFRFNVDGAPCAIYLKQKINDIE